jgi:hypothetical protein
MNRYKTLVFVCAVVVMSLSLATVRAQQSRAPRASARALSPEQREAKVAFDARRRELGLPLGDGLPAPRDCSVEKTCPNGTRVSCSASGKFTDCGGVYNGDGALMGVGCFAFKTADPGGGKVSVNQSTCG